MNKKLTLTAIIMLILICITTGGVSANYQSSPNVTSATTDLATWMTAVRAMEASRASNGIKRNFIQ